MIALLAMAPGGFAMVSTRLSGGTWGVSVALGVAFWAATILLLYDVGRERSGE